MTRLLNGAVALVTGGNSGLGLAAATAFAREGARVVIAARRSVQGRAAVSGIEAAGGEALFVQADVSRSADVEAMVDSAMNRFGRLDYAFNNAGRAAIAPIAELSETLWDEIIDTNLKGVWLCLKYELPAILASGGGAIVNNASISALGGWSGGALYTASKHGIIGLTKSAAIEYVTQSIRINAVCTGNFDTPIWDTLDLPPESRANLGASQPMGRLGRPEELAEAVIWLCSSAASYVTGAAIPIDGGRTAGP